MKKKKNKTKAGGKWIIEGPGDANVRMAWGLNDRLTPFFLASVSSASYRNLLAGHKGEEEES